MGLQRELINYCSNVCVHFVLIVFLGSVAVGVEMSIVNNGSHRATLSDEVGSEVP